MIPKKSRTKGELIKAVVVEFHNWSTLVLTQDQYNEIGNYLGLLRAFNIPVGKIKKKRHILLNPSDFPTQDWCG